MNTSLIRSRALLACLGVLAMAGCAPEKPHPDAALAWAYPHAAPAPLPSPPPGFQHVPGSKLTLTLAQVNDEQSPPDWNPEEHPTPPTIVAHGRVNGPTPCGECHLLNGVGFLAAPDLAGLPAAYIAEQVHEFRDGRRLSAETGRPATQEMITVADKVSDSELASAAAYFSALPRRPRYRVVETDMVPATRPDYYGWLDLDPKRPAEPIAGRVIEVPEDTIRMYLEDPHMAVLDYAPKGSVARGEALVRSGGGGGQACASCHRPHLEGLGAAPPLAGRSAAYLARMLWDIKTGARRGAAVAQMQTPAAGLSEADITNVTAYLASLNP